MAFTGLSAVSLLAVSFYAALLAVSFYADLLPVSFHLSVGVHVLLYSVWI